MVLQVMIKNNGIIANYTKYIADIIFPPRCLCCADNIIEHGNLCADCWADTQFITEPFCDICGYPQELEVDLIEGICSFCTAKKPSYQKARALFSYENAGLQLIHNLKYYDKQHIAEPLSKMLYSKYSDIIMQADIIVPVPIHWRRLLMRKYNQSLLMSNCLSKFSGKPVIADLLYRTKYTAPQNRMNYKERYRNIKDIIKVTDKYQDMIAGKNILLVDDVITTGATINGCAKELTKAGSCSINVVTFAKTIL